MNRLLALRSGFTLAAVAAVLLGISSAQAQAGHDTGHTPSGVPVKPAITTPAVRTFAAIGLPVDTDNPPPGSDVARAGAWLNGAYLSVVYGRPYTRGRDVFGGVVPFGEVWAVGAHLASEMVVTAPVRFGGRTLGPGVYSLFATPNPGQWRVHLNAALGGHGTDGYDVTRNVISVDAAAETLAEPVPALTLDFVPDGDGVALRVQWDRTAIRVPIRSMSPASSGPAALEP